MNALLKFEDYTVRAEKAAVVIIITAMVVLSFMQVLLRILFHSGIVWLDPMLRHFVLWAGFLGAALAARYQTHFALDVFSKLTSEKRRKTIKIFISLFTAAVALLLLYAACKFIRDEAAAGSVAFYVKTFAVKGCFAEAVIPLAFGLIAFHSLTGIFRPETQDEAVK